MAAINTQTGQPLQATWTIHDSYNNGEYVQVSIARCKGPDCPKKDGPPIWQAGTANVTVVGDFPHPTGHNSMSASEFFNSSNPTFQSRLLSSPAPATTVGRFACGPCQDQHFVGDVKNDANPLLGTTGGTPNQEWTAPYKSELWGLSTDGSGTVWRFAKTYSTGTAASNFEGRYAIGSASQDRTIFCFTSDMLGQLGTYMNGKRAHNRTDVFCVGLTGRLTDRIDSESGASSATR
ncbi:MAG: hypothetical protein WBQ08_16315 [Candidatus Sulfotelmatobacter sp.]